MGAGACTSLPDAGDGEISEGRSGGSEVQVAGQSSRQASRKGTCPWRQPGVGNQYAAACKLRGTSEGLEERGAFTDGSPLNRAKIRGDGVSGEEDLPRV